MTTESKALAIIPRTGIVLPAVDTEGAVAAWNTYVALCKAVIGPEDIQKTYDGDFRKKSAFRKLARFYDLTDKVAGSEIQRDDRGRPIFAAFTVRATAPNGREAEGYHECHLSERCCPALESDQCDRAKFNKKHKCCLPTCSGWSHWSHPGDIPATAHTRAKNRAISDLIGAGEVSAEEVGDSAPEEVAADAVRHDVDRSLGWCSLHKCGKVEGKYGPYCPNRLTDGHWCKGDPDAKAAAKPAPAPATKPEGTGAVVVGETRLVEPEGRLVPPKNLAELMQRAQDELGLPIVEAKKVLGIRETTEIADIGDAWAKLCVAKAKGGVS
mgnify:CR=1 FL=1